PDADAGDDDVDVDGPSAEPSAAAAPVAPMTPITPPTPLPPDPFDGPSPDAAVAASDALGLDPMVTAPAAPAAPPAAAPAACGVFGNGAPHALGAGVSRARVGRGRSNDIVLQDASVSREHGEFMLRGGVWFVRDLDSTNGVAVNGSKVTEARLEPGDVVRFGNADLRFDRWRGGQE
ncbi:MAG: FHA domain-containing protein, partial [Thermoleophilia bacterium]|nr:FHA domain-containing protein [Thermoleophilia bacterium]